MYLASPPLAVLDQISKRSSTIWEPVSLLIIDTSMKVFMLTSYSSFCADGELLHGRHCGTLIYSTLSDIFDPG